MAAKVNEWYSMKLPREFYALANLARKLQPLQPCAAFEGAGVQLVGPFELLLTGAFERECSPGDRASIHQHYRFPYDPPEAMTVALEVKKGKQRFSGKHWAYFRDSPDEDPAFVVTGTARCGKLDVEGDYLANVLLARCRGVRGKDEPKVAPIVAQLSGLLGKLGLREGANDRSRTRKRKVVAKTFHTLGMVCPFDRKADLGYRPLSIPGSKLKTMLDQLLAAKDTGEKADFAQLDELISFANISNDEGDFGQALELGLDLFSHASEFKRDACQLLVPTYKLLGRDVFADIVEAHTERGRPMPDEGGSLSALTMY